MIPPTIQLRPGLDGPELLHNADQPLLIVLHPADTSVHRPTSQSVLPRVWTRLSIPSDDHEWVALPELGDPGLTEICTGCPATRRTSLPTRAST